MFSPAHITYLEQFDTKHGADAVRIDGWFLYSDGARREDSQPIASCYEPPEDPAQRGALQIKYREELLKRATQNFHDLQQSLTAQVENARKWAHANTPPQPPTEDQFEKLEDLKAKVVRCQQALEKIRKQVQEETSRNPDYIERERRTAETRKRVEAASERLQKIKI